MMLSNIIRKIFGTKTIALSKELQAVKKINALEPTYEKMSDEALKEAFNAFKADVMCWSRKIMLIFLNDIFALTREASKRTTGMRHFDVQMIAFSTHGGDIAEMKIGVTSISSSNFSHFTLFSDRIFILMDIH